MSDWDEITWSNKPSNPDDQPLTIEALSVLIKRLPDPKSIVATFEAGSEELAQWITSKVISGRAEPALHYHYPIGVTVAVGDFLPPHVFITRDRDGKPMTMFVRRGDEILALPLTLQAPYERI